jgi:hypothetical protein
MEKAMAAAILEGAGGRAAPARNTCRRSVARIVAADARRLVSRRELARIGLDDAGLASVAVDQQAQDCLGRRVFFL